MGDSLPNPLWVVFPDHQAAVRFWFDAPMSMNFRSYSVCSLDGPVGKGQWALLDCWMAHPLSKWETTFWDIDGQLKWDGCINWQTNPDCMRHGCSPSHAEEIASTFRTIYHVGKRHFDLLGAAVSPLPEGAIEFNEKD